MATVKSPIVSYGPAYAYLVKNQSAYGENLFNISQKVIKLCNQIHFKSGRKLSLYSKKNEYGTIIAFFLAGNFKEMTALLNVSIEKLIERWDFPISQLRSTLCPRFLISYMLFHQGKSRIISCLIILSTTLSRQHDSRIQTHFAEYEYTYMVQLCL